MPAPCTPAAPGRAHLRIPRSPVEDAIDQVGLESAAGRRVERYSLDVRQLLDIAAGGWPLLRTDASR